MKLISATLMTAAGAAAAMLWMNKDRYLNRSFRTDEGRRPGTPGGGGTEPDFSGEGAAPSISPAVATH